MKAQSTRWSGHTADRRSFALGAAAALAAAALPRPARANVPVPYDWNASPPTDARTDFVDWMAKNRGEDRGYLGQRWDRFQQVLAKRDLWDQRDFRAFLLTPRVRSHSGLMISIDHTLSVRFER